MVDAARARDVLEQILAKMGISAEVEVREDAERITLDVKGPDGGLVIGKKGATLDSLQYLVMRIIHRGTEGAAEGAAEADAGKPVQVDTEGYRARRVEALVALAHRLSEKAIRSRRTIEVDPMSPADRRVIHVTLAQVPGVTTRSEGEGSFRRLLIVPAPDKV